MILDKDGNLWVLEANSLPGMTPNSFVPKEAAAVGMSPAAVSHHLKTLRLHGLLRSRREGKEIHYTLADNEKARLLHRLIDDYFQLECPLK